MGRVDIGAQPWAHAIMMVLRGVRTPAITGACCASKDLTAMLVATAVTLRSLSDFSGWQQQWRCLRQTRGTGST